MSEYMSDSNRAKLGILVHFLDNVLLRLQHRSGNKFISPAMDHNKLAFLEIVNVSSDDRKKSLVRRIQKGVLDLNATMEQLEISAVFLGTIIYVMECKANKSLPIKDGTHFAYVFGQMAKNIEMMMPAFKADDIDPVKEILREFLKAV